MRKLKRFTQEEFNNFKVVGIRKKCPKGDYSSIRFFGNNCDFKGGSVFSSNSTFGVKNNFGPNCIFGNFSSFGEHCRFDIKCYFGKTSHFGVSCVFKPECKFMSYSSFSHNCLFYQKCLFDSYSSFGANCEFGEECSFRLDNNFGESCRFLRSCSFGSYCLFGDRCDFGELCSFTKVGIFIIHSKLGEVSKKICLELMRRDADTHMDKKLFNKWAKGEECPYKGSKFIRVHHFTENKKIWKPGKPQMSTKNLILSIMKEKNWILK